MTKKPLGHKNYGSIPHLPNSRMGPGDHSCHEGQARIATEQTRDKHDRIIITEKLDGSNVGVVLLNGRIIPLTRSGYPADTSPYEQHHMFAKWVFCNEARFRAVLRDGERLVGEWMAQAHGTRYDFGPSLEPFAAFDLMCGQVRAVYNVFRERILPGEFCSAPHLHATNEGISVPFAMNCLEGSYPSTGRHGFYGALEPVEGAVWRVERNKIVDRQTGRREWVVDFLVKYVRPDKVDGKYLPSVSGKEAVWNWRPEGWGDDSRD